MNKINQTASEVKNSNRTSTEAHETRKNKLWLSMFVFAALVVSAAVVISCGGGSGGSSSAKGLSGTYEIDDRPGYTRTFAGDKHTFEGPGFKSEGTFTISDDELTITASDGDVTTYKFKLNGNKLEMANSKAKLDDPDQWQKLTKK